MFIYISLIYIFIQYTGRAHRSERRYFEFFGNFWEKGRNMCSDDQRNSILGEIIFGSGKKNV